ncbi:translation initiation factor 1A [Hamiltosporidium magnivora]|uniref:Translation initiation factor 1A n=1 Tax=Hamiltosporidium magnivora TaxID=148818 RepID=A0A4Q9KZZ8_9MICR|nr:translation initiation factor 1A [Hamiltosporidium magnivora]
MKPKSKKRSDNLTRSITFAEEGVSVYGQIIRPFGNYRFEVRCSDMITRNCILRGKMLKRDWVQPNDIVLINLREDTPEKGDVLLKYTPAEVKVLRKNKYIPDTFGEEVIGGLSNVEFENL